jgi:hypothetical protein
MKLTLKVLVVFGRPSVEKNVRTFRLKYNECISVMNYVTFLEADKMDVLIKWIYSKTPI